MQRDKSLREKLEIKEHSRAIFLNTTIEYIKSLQLSESIIVEEKLEWQFDFIQFFAQDKNELEKMFPRLKQSLKKGGVLWISWKKGKIDPFSQLNENKVQKLGLQNGLVDIKVVSIDDVWSALKFVFRTKDRSS